MENTDLIGKVNAGHTIIKQGNKAVIGRKEMPEYNIVQYVAWHYWRQEDGTVAYGWGRYGSQETAEKWFAAKEAGIYLTE